MTVTTPPEDPEVFRPSGHPVAWFVTVVTGIAIVSCLTWWAGLVTARVAVTSHDITRNSSSIAVFDLAVVNNGPLAVDIVGAGLTGAPAQPVGPVKLGSGERAVVQVTVGFGDCYSRLLRVDVRSPIGVVRTIKLPNHGFGGWCPLERALPAQEQHDDDDEQDRAETDVHGAADRSRPGFDRTFAGTLPTAVTDHVARHRGSSAGCPANRCQPVDGVPDTMWVLVRPEDLPEEEREVEPMSALPHDDDAVAGHPPMAPDVLAWRKQFQGAIEDGFFRSLPSAKEQSAAVRKELGLPKR